jgi:hypothetical protein
VGIGLALLVLAVGGCDLFLPPAATTVTIVPASGVVGTQVTIVGTGFGMSQGGSEVSFGGLEAAVLSWRDTSITARVTQPPETGPETKLGACVGSPSPNTSRTSFVTREG